MRRLPGFVLAGALMLMPALSGGDGTALAQQAPQKLTFDADAVVWMVTVRQGKTADYEEVMAALKDALNKSDKPEAKQQAAGWKIVRAKQPQPDGSIVYAHIINPVVKEADYGVLPNIYAAVTDPTAQRAIYDKYAGAFASTLMQAPFDLVTDLGK